MKVYFKVLVVVTICSFVIMFHSGCTDPSITDTPRNIIEQVLISSAVERCIHQMDINEYRGSKIFVDYSNLATQTDMPFVKGHFELHLAKYGIVLVKDEKEALYTMRLIVGTLATDSNKLLVGVPPLPIPLPNTSINFSSPEIALFKRHLRRGFGKFSLTVLDTTTQKPLRIYESVMSKTLFVDYTIMFIPFLSNNLIMVDADGIEYDMELFQ